MAVVSIGIPFISGLSHFQQAVNSVFAQSLRDWELLLVGDRPDVACESYARSIRDSRVRVLCNDSRLGLAASLNRIARLASADILFRMDADDIMHPQRLEVQAKLMANDLTIDVAGSGAYVIDENTNLLGSYRRPAIPSTTWQALASGYFIHPTVVGRTAWFRNNPYDPRYIRAQDKALWISSVNHSKFVSTNEKLLYYRLHSEESHDKRMASSRFNRMAVSNLGVLVAPRHKIEAYLAISVAKDYLYSTTRKLGLKRLMTTRRICEVEESEQVHARRFLQQAVYPTNP